MDAYVVGARRCAEEKRKKAEALEIGGKRGVVGHYTSVKISRKGVALHKGVNAICWPKLSLTRTPGQTL